MPQGYDGRRCDDSQSKEEDACIKGGRTKRIVDLSIDYRSSDIQVNAERRSRDADAHSEDQNDPILQRIDPKSVCQWQEYRSKHKQSWQSFEDGPNHQKADDACDDEPDFAPRVGEYHQELRR